MGTLIFILLALGLAGATAYFVMRSRDDQRALPGRETAGQLETELGTSDRSLMELQLQDIVSHYGTDYIVEGKIQYREGGWTWVEYRLEDGDEIRWLEAEEDDGLQATLWREVDDLHIGADEPPEFLEYEGVEFRISERGEARAQQEGKTGKKQGLTVEYFEYEGPEDRLLAVERWGGDVEVSKGKPIEPYELDVLPGDSIHM